jgi:hypothetical protein
VKIRRHLTYANVASTVTLILALGGSAAYAVDKIKSHDIVNDSIRSADLKNRAAVRARDVRRNALTGREINERTLDARSITQVTGNETGRCVPLAAPTNCTRASIDLKRASRLLVIATGNEESLGRPAAASCRITIDGVGEALAVAPGEQAADNTSGTATNGFARTFVSPSRLSAGAHTVALSCKRLIGNVRIDSPTIAAVAVGVG